MSGPAAVLDACVLFPFQLRNLLLHLTAFNAYTPLWSATIMEECRRNLVATGRCTPEQADHLENQLRLHFADAWQEGFEHLVPILDLPDADDRHVLALAVHFEAEYLVTRNLKHFPMHLLRPYGIVPIHPDGFIHNLFVGNPVLVRQAAEAHRCDAIHSARTSTS